MTPQSNHNYQSNWLSLAHHWTDLGLVFKGQVASLALVQMLATRWCYFNWLPMWPPDGTTFKTHRSDDTCCIDYIVCLTLQTVYKIHTLREITHCIITNAVFYTQNTRLCTV